MTENLTSNGVAMMLVGGVMVAFAIVVILLTDNSAPSALAIIGLVSLGVGTRKRRT